MDARLRPADKIRQRRFVKPPFEVLDLIPWSFCVGLCLAAMGCGRSNGGRLPVTGSVIGPGAEKLTGSISFIPDVDRSSPGAVASLVNGHYCFDGTNGPGPGRYRILIRRAVTKTRANQTSKPGLALATGESIARGATVEWTFAREIVAKGPYQIDFNLD